MSDRHGHEFDQVVRLPRIPQEPGPGLRRPEQDNPTAGLTDLEHQAMDLTAQLWHTLCHIVGTEWTAGNDLNELASHIHVIQNAVLAQAAARAHPDRYRLLGGILADAVQVAGEPRG